MPISPVYDTSAFAALRWREIGPFRGGRSVAVAGSSKRPNEYYFGTTGGGVFKTTDGGITWAPATDNVAAINAAIAAAPDARTTGRRYLRNRYVDKWLIPVPRYPDCRQRP